ncbi:NmrA-like family protein [Aspergillus nomiae NRRL 13137]|uniref:NmrA-like family protein n=1 Tax=Aspergillus nomiae NRRL (strain ATCC 15546 / NRRL 13137 / CBS 260.88 / M93) TaxID=1509407 RepID=A0A0L1IRC2_ASPN3|nr:NmrA-like family protein [Aspergillus nomiae NRRL 13137]KNG81758.1 NmrA-like family protein [Aspergillus nomiae NRRL 13137]
MAGYKNIVLVGASGAIGKIIIDCLIASSSFNITVLSRKESKASFPAGITVHKSDFSDADLEAVFKGQDAVISAVGATAFGEQKKVVDAAIRSGVQRFIPSEFSSNSQNEAVLKLAPFFGQKKELIEYLKTKQSDGLSWTAVATSGLLDWGLENGFLEFDVANHTATIWDGGNQSFTLTNEKQLGQAVVSVLQHPQETSNKYLYIASVETTQNEILAALEEATGAKWSVKATTTEDQVDEGFKKLGAGDFSGAFQLVRATCYGNTPGLQANYAKDVTLANDVLGLKLESVRDTVKRVVA